MKMIIVLISLVHFNVLSFAEAKSEVVGQLIKIEANPKQGFYFPFFLYIPKVTGLKQRLLVIPNNSGSSLDDYSAQVYSAKRQALSWGGMAERISTILLVPCFPRPNVEPAIYTHSLSRSTLQVKEGELRRVDLQLLKMIEEARKIVPQYGVTSLEKKIFLFGFSASAMFANRFAFIHPEIVEAVAFGAPGGWPLAPLKEYQGKTLNFPVGIADLKKLTDYEFNLEAVKNISFFAFLGSKDENDSVVSRDSYSEADEKIVFSLFGKNPVARWPLAEKIYKEAGLNAKFKIYEGLGHETNGKIQSVSLVWTPDSSIRSSDPIPV